MSHRILNLLRINRNILFINNYNTFATSKLIIQNPQHKFRNATTLVTNNKTIPAPAPAAAPPTLQKLQSNQHQQQPSNSINSNLNKQQIENIQPETYEELYQNIKSYFKVNNRIHPEYFQKIIHKLEPSITKDDSIFLLEICSDYLPTQTSTQRMDFFHEIWNYLKNNTTLLDKCHYLIALKVFQSNKMHLANIQEIFVNCPIKNDAEIYEGLIQLACETGDMTAVTEIITEMDDKKMSLTENIFNSLILGHGRKKNLKGSQSVIQTMNAANILPSTETMTQLIRANIENSNFQHAEQLIHDNELKFNTEQIIKILKSAILMHQMNLINKLIKLLPNELLKVKELNGIFKNICIELLYSGETEKSFNILNAFPIPKFNDNEDKDTFGVFFINELIKCEENTNKILEICENLRINEKNTRALHIACEIILRTQPKKAIQYLKELSKIEKLRPHYFWPLLIYNFRQSGEIGILKILKKMSELNVEFDYETISKYCLPYLSICLNDNFKAVQTLENCGLITSQFLTPMISDMIMQHKQKEILKLNELYQTKLDTSKFVFPMSFLAIKMPTNKRYEIFAKLTQSLIHKSEDSKFDLAGQFLIEMLNIPKIHTDPRKLITIIINLHAIGIKISSSSADILSLHLLKYKDQQQHQHLNIDRVRNYLKDMINNNLNAPTNQSSSSVEMSGINIKHPRDMNIDELECHLIELEAKNLNSRGILRKLLQMTIRENRLDRALELKKKCMALKVNISPGMQASIIEMYVKLKDLNAAEENLKYMKKMFPGFLVDEHKIIDLAALLVENKQFEKACQLLIERSSTTRIMGGDNIHKNIWNLLMKTAAFSALPENASSASNNQNRTKELFQLLSRSGYCKPRNVILGPIIREFMYKNQIKLAVAEFQEFAEKYKKTPLLFELTSLLVSISNGKNLEIYQITETEAKEMLQNVISLSGEIHGGQNANSTLLLAFAESGTENQLRKLLINPEFHINPDALIKNCEHLSTTGKIETILKLAKACRGLGHVLKEDTLYNILMDNFVKDNNYTAGLELFDKLEADDDLKISQEFLRNLINMLNMNKIEIPTGIALRTQLRN